MGEKSSFTKAEVAGWHRERRQGARRNEALGTGTTGEACLHCGQPLRADDFAAAEHGFCSCCIDLD